MCVILEHVWVKCTCRGCSPAAKKIPNESLFQYVREYSPKSNVTVFPQYLSAVSDLIEYEADLALHTYQHNVLVINKAMNSSIY